MTFPHKSDVKKHLAHRSKKTSYLTPPSPTPFNTDEATSETTESLFVSTSVAYSFADEKQVTTGKAE